jgi:hypothetical protein
MRGKDLKLNAVKVICAGTEGQKMAWPRSISLLRYAGSIVPLDASVFKEK